MHIQFRSARSLWSLDVWGNCGAMMGGQPFLEFVWQNCYPQYKGFQVRIFNTIDWGGFLWTWYLTLFISHFYVQLGPKAEDVEKPVNSLVFFLRFILGAIAATYFVIVPIYMWLKDRIVPKGMPIWKKKESWRRSLISSPWGKPASTFLTWYPLNRWQFRNL